MTQVPQCDQFGDPVHADRASCADVDRVTHRVVRLQRANYCLNDVTDVDEISRLEPVLEDQWRVIVQEPRREDRRNTVYGFERLGLVRRR